MRPEEERTISHRITEEAWSEVEKRVANAGENLTNGLVLHFSKSSAGAVKWHVSSVFCSII